jgi:hypothetical protein
MEHSDVKSLQAVEKYVLGELSPAIRDEFEAHYFDCHECALAVRTGVAFAAASCQFFAEASLPDRVPTPAASRWFAWFQPMIAVPAMAALLLVVGYQNLVSIPRLKQSAASAVGTVEPWFSLVNSNVHGSAAQRFELHPGQGFHLFFDITAAPKQPDSVFVLHVVDPSGKVLLARTVPGAEAQKSILLSISPGFAAGDYKLVILDQSGSSTALVSEIPFTVAFSS